MPRSAPRFVLLAPLLLLVALPASAHNGTVAMAVPVEGISIDGDLSDWPEGMREYPIEYVWVGSRTTEKGDLQGHYRVGYNPDENAVYVGAVVDDDYHDPQHDWSAFPKSTDAAEIYLEAGHDSGVRRLHHSALVGDGSYSVAGTPAQAAMRHSGSQQQYEWRIEIPEDQPLHVGQVLGFEVVVTDLDPDGVTIHGLGPGAGKTDFYGPTPESNRADLVLIERTAEMGRIGGTVLWEDGRAAAYVGVLIQSLADAECWVKARTDRHGRFRSEVPRGRYRVEPAAGRLARQAVTVAVTGPTGQRADLTIRGDDGQAVDVGGGTRIPSGRGVRQGRMRVLGISDGLPSSTISAMHQDRTGAIWLGTGRLWLELEEGEGVLRYDGSEFVLLSTEDGLVDNTVLAIAEDGGGRLWFGTYRGLSCYDGETFTNYTTDDGLVGNWVHALIEDRDGRLWIGTDRGVSVYDGEAFDNFTMADGLASDMVNAVLVDDFGKVWLGTNGGLTVHDGSAFSSFTVADGLAGDAVISLGLDRSGNLWCGTRGDGVSRYDGRGFTTYRDEERRANYVPFIAQDGVGDLWFGTGHNGVRRYDGESWVGLTSASGLPSNLVSAMAADRDGGVWFAALGGGLTRYDPDQITTFTTRDGLDSDVAFSLLEDTRGSVWCTTTGQPGGICRYDGERFACFPDVPWPKSIFSIAEDAAGDLWFGTLKAEIDGDSVRFLQDDALPADPGAVNYTDAQGVVWFAAGGEIIRYDGLRYTRLALSRSPPGRINAMVDDRAGGMWFGSSEGLFRWDGVQLVTMTAATGPAGKYVRCLLVDAQTQLWVGTWGHGLYRFDGETWSRFDEADGLPDNAVMSLAEDGAGRLWIGTWGGGLACHDGRVFQRIGQVDGLGNNVVQKLAVSHTGDLWVTTEGGVTRYRPSRTPPSVRVTNIWTDHPLGPATSVKLPSTQDYLRFDFQGASMTSHADRMVYLYRLRHLEEEWESTGAGTAEYIDLPVGRYIFEVKAVDRDLNYSEAMEVQVVVHYPIARLAVRVALAMALLGLIGSSTYALKKRRDMFIGMQDELEDARRMQMGLMPTASPQVEGVAVAGRCVPANHVGGDFYQYFGRHGCLTISLADATGHAMEAAIPAVMFSGILDNQMEQPKPLPELFQSLNRSLCRSLGEHTYVCLSMLDLEQDCRSMKVANCGCPYPLLFRHATRQIEEIQVEAYPLGIRHDTEYSATEVSLSPGDYVVLHSDGFSEAADAREHLFGFDGTTEVIRRGCSEGLSPEDLIERLITEVKAFAGNEPQADDMTCVVIKVEA